MVTLTVVALVAAPFLAGRAALAIEAVVRRVRDALPDIFEVTILVVVLTPMSAVAVTLRRGQRSARSYHLSVRIVRTCRSKGSFGTHPTSAE